MGEKLKISFSLDESDVAYFRNLLRKVRRHGANQPQESVIRAVRDLIIRVRASKKTPRILEEAVRTLEDLIQMIEDKDYAVPSKIANDVLAALTYFLNPADLVPDYVPGLGFLDDAIMIKLVEDEFKQELWGYRKFRNYRDTSEHRPWTRVARERLRPRLDEYRKRVRSEIDVRKRTELERRQRAQSAKRTLSW